jgi:hypothetical protein
MIEFAPQSPTTLTYNQALLYCQFLDYGGHNDWRMPNLNQSLLSANIIKGGKIGWCTDRFAQCGQDYVDWFHVTPVRDI